ncbi:sensor histidine kinase [Haloferula luteola]|nr:HAMP domain-containing sensor histidine kinase [Haloferula luteola]
MRPAWFTLLPMFALALLTAIAAERLARRTEENRTPIDRDQLLALDDVLRQEFARLDSLFRGYLQRDAQDLLYRGHLSDPGAGVRRIQLFRKKGPERIYDPRPQEVGPPEITLVDARSPFNPDHAVVLERDWLDRPIPEQGVWLSTPSSDYKIHLSRPESGVLCAALIHLPEVQERLASHLQNWLREPAGPLKQTGASFRIEAPHGDSVYSIGPSHEGPAAAILPIHTFSGTWQIRGWDRVTQNHDHDPATLATGWGFSLILAACGLLLHRQQRRALQLASERVSFVNRVSHELGSPLTNLSLNLDLADDAIDQDRTAAHQRLSLVREEIARLSRLVANVLTFSRRERNALQLSPVRCLPDEILMRVADTFAPALERRGIQLERSLASGVAVILDPDALEQIAGNLLSNVEKYAASGHRATLISAWQNGVFSLTVSDLGPGIPPADQERIFRPFERVHSSTHEGSSGTGLGLAIGRELARRHGGDLHLRKSHRGARFELQIPAPAAEPLHRRFQVA